MREIKIDEIIVGERVRKDLGDIDALMTSINKVGLISPISVFMKWGKTKKEKTEYILVAGFRRLEACKRLEWEYIDATKFGYDGLTQPIDMLYAEQEENTCRKDFTPSEAVAMGKAIKGAIAAAAKQRQQEGRNQHSEPSSESDEGSKGRTDEKGEVASTSSDSNKVDNGHKHHFTKRSERFRTDEKVAAAVGMKKDKYREAVAVVDAAKEDPETFGPIVEEMDQTGKVHPAFKKVKAKKKAMSVPEEKPAPPTEFCVPTDDIKKAAKIIAQYYSLEALSVALMDDE